LQSYLPDTRGVIAKTNDVTIICFSGTDPVNVRDWIVDLSIGAFAGDLHEGFQNALDLVWKNGKAVFEAVKAGGPLIFTGHSLGGALAMIAAERALREQKLNNADVYTFGMPRVGKADFSNRYQKLAKTTFRFIHGEDVVPTVPPTELGFVHVGQYRHCESGGRFAVDDPGGVGERPGEADGNILKDIGNLASRLTAWPNLVSFRDDLVGRASKLLTPGIADHVPDRYYHAFGDGK
jgi:predicted lipase